MCSWQAVAGTLDDSDPPTSQNALKDSTGSYCPAAETGWLAATMACPKGLDAPLDAAW